MIIINCRWEVRRLLAARDCTALDTGGKGAKWLVALRLPRDMMALRSPSPINATVSGSARGNGNLTEAAGGPAGRSSVMTLPTAATVSSAVLRARSSLMVLIHPDKCDPADSGHANEAFAFLQQATAGLLAMAGAIRL